MSRHVIIVAAITACVGVAVACSSSDSGTSSGSSGTSSGSSGGASGGGSSGTSGSGSGFKQCGSSTSTCTEADTKDYNDCIISKCDSQFKTCYGSGYQSGSFAGGTCETFISCFQACPCNDTACLQKCGQPAQACSTCLQNVGTCTQGSGCTVPACESGSSSGTSGSSGTTGKTCADLTACCATVTDANQKSACTQIAGSGANATCNAVYDTYCP